MIADNVTGMNPAINLFLPQNSKEVEFLQTNIIDIFQKYESKKLLKIISLSHTLQYR